MIDILPLNVRAVAEPSTERSRLVKAAVKHEYHVYTGWRHSEIFRHMTGLGLDLGSPNVAAAAQGFVDQFGVFYGRYQAARIAYHAKQITTIPPMLTSEDLWDDEGTPREPSKAYDPMGDMGGKTLATRRREDAVAKAAEWRDRNRGRG